MKYIAGDIRDAKVVSSAIAGADVVFHLAAIVGTFHPKKLFAEVNYDGKFRLIHRPFLPHFVCTELGVGEGYVFSDASAPSLLLPVRIFYAHVVYRHTERH